MEISHLIPASIPASIPALGSILLSLLVPFGIFMGRSNIRARRYQIVLDLENLFKFARQADGDPLIIPSFELVKYKYQPAGEREQEIDAQTARYYTLPVCIYILVALLGFYLALFPLDKVQNVGINAFRHGADLYKDSKNFIALISYTFIGGYIWTLQYLIRRVANYDLSPVSFFRSAIHILLGFFISATIAQSGVLSWVGPGLMLGFAFLIGFFPTLCLDVLVAKFPWLRLKRVSKDTQELQEEIPLDAVNGIDPFMKFRLAEFEIEDVQNLATINPLQIFVETPYGLYQVLDWVAQAQLILAVGSAKAMLLRRLGVRTVFDLERMLDNALLKQKLGTILMGETMPAPEGAPGQQRQAAVTGFSEIVLDHRDPVEALVAVIRDDLHVKRLRQIWDVIAGRLDRRPASAGTPAGTVEPDECEHLTMKTITAVR